MNQEKQKYIEGSDSLNFNLRALRSRDSSRRKHHLDLVCLRAKKLANDRQTEVLKYYLPVILRLSNVCPFEDVRKEFTILLQELKVSWTKNMKCTCQLGMRGQQIDFRQNWHLCKGIIFPYLNRQAGRKCRERFMLDLRFSFLQKRFVDIQCIF